MFPILTTINVHTEFPKTFHAVTNKCEVYVYHYKYEGAHIIFKTKEEIEWTHEKCIS